MSFLETHEKRLLRARNSSKNRNHDKLNNHVNGQSEAEKPRRSSRGLRQSLPHKEAGSDEVVFIISTKNIRKKLNFKENAFAGDQSPRKRARYNKQQCFAYVAVYDNRGSHGMAEPVVTKTQGCTLLSRERSDGSKWVDIELDQPFKITAKELFVPNMDKRGRRQPGVSMGVKYFLELKIQPCDEMDEMWPPIPLLSTGNSVFKSDLMRQGLQEAQGMLCALYKGLPESSSPGTGWPVSFLYGGTTFNTKYSLEVDASWQQVPQEDNIFAVLDIEPRSSKRKTGQSPDNSTTPELNNQLKPNVRVKYLWDVQNTRELGRALPIRAPLRTPSKTSSSRVLPQSVKQENIVVDGFECPICSAFKAKRLNQLLLHLPNNHLGYDFIVLNEDRRQSDGNIHEVTIRVRATRSTSEEPSGLEPKTTEIIHCTPAFDSESDPFDNEAHLSGDTRWTQHAGRKIYNEQPSATKLFATKSRDTPGSSIEDVQDMPLPIRKRHKPIRSRTAANLPLYRSISHRPIRLSESDLSETDDDVDTDWLTQRQMDVIDESTALSAPAKEFRKRWDRHIIDERYPHSKYLPDTLKRFVKKNLDWLRGKDMYIQFRLLCDQLHNSRFITMQTVEVCSEWIGFDWSANTRDKSTIASHGNEIEKKMHEDAERALTDRYWEQSTPDSDTCPACQRTLFGAARRSVACTNSVSPRCRSRSWY